MKSFVIYPATMILVSLAASCNQQTTVSHAPSSFELDLQTRDTINLVMNGWKQGKWIETKNGKKDTLYYRNDTLIAKP